MGKFPEKQALTVAGDQFPNSISEANQYAEIPMTKPAATRSARRSFSPTNAASRRNDAVLSVIAMSYGRKSV